MVGRAPYRCILFSLPRRNRADAVETAAPGFRDPLTSQEGGAEADRRPSSQ